LSFPFIVSLIVGITLVAFAFARFQVKAEKRALRTELEKRAEILAESLEEIVRPLLEKRSRKDLQRIVERFGNRERLAGVVVFSTSGTPLAITPALASQLSSPPELVTRATAHNVSLSTFLNFQGTYTHLYALPLR